MRLLAVLCVLGSIVSPAVPVAARQDHHASADGRAASVMGFDQERTTHHFLLSKDGGAIDVGVKESRDIKNLDAIRSHLPHIATMFGNGNFDAPMLVHDSARAWHKGHGCPEGRDSIPIRRDSEGGRVSIVTSDREALVRAGR